MAAWEADRLVADVQRLAVRGLPRDEFHRELAARIRRVVPIDATCWHGLDPRTLMMTTADPVELKAGGFLTSDSEPVAIDAVLSSEYRRDDYNSFATIARRRHPVGILGESTRGRPARSARYREFLAPYGTPFELRTAFVSKGRPWGCVVLHRTERSGDFTAAEARLIARLSRPIAEGLRASVRLDAARRQDHAAAPGLILLGRRDEIQLITPPARVLLDDLTRADPAAPRDLPLSVLALAAVARRHARGEAPSLQVPSAAGWLSLHASVPEGAGSDLVAIVIQRAGPETAIALELESYGLTEREREVAGLAVRGLTTEVLAERLSLSPWTVQDHFKSIFEKTGTHSRRELRALVFFDEYLPAIGTQRPLDADGGLMRARR
ncbi:MULTISPECIES: helix-turn-helix transcriptional regulator [unclassified Kribbella]|uniref:helix-turn-helix transcriptional regulator n=1 Tax=unclassified Kribbella TaxID=2644121 RepID=UPI0033CF8E50